MPERGYQESLNYENKFCMLDQGAHRFLNEFECILTFFSEEILKVLDTHSYLGYLHGRW